MGLSGGLALFLFGLDQLSDGLKQAAGDTLKTLLTRLTSNRFLGALTGALVTGILNSSSVTTVLVVGFVTAGVLSLAQSVAVIMGANVGSTVTAQILAFNLSAYALLPIGVGFFMLFFGKRSRLRQWGMMLMGLGLVFYGMGLMSDAMTPLRSYAPFASALASMEKPLYGILAGAIFTGLVQSSAATVGIAIALASDGVLSLPAGIALALGANLGTCATALLAALGRPVEAVRAASVHVLFNALGVLIWLPFLNTLAGMTVALSPASPGLVGTARLAADVPRQIANANTLFNVLNTLFFIGFTGSFARLATRLVRARPEKPNVVTSRFIDESALSVPALALEQVRQELGRLGDTVRAMLIEFPPTPGAVAEKALEEIVGHRNQVQTIEAAILEFLGHIRQGALTRTESETQIALTTAALHLREVADVVADDLVGVARGLGKQPAHARALERTVAGEFYQAIRNGVELACQAVREQDSAAANKVILMSESVRKMAEELIAQLAGGLQAGDTETLTTLRLQTSFVDSLRQIFTLTRRVSRTVLAQPL
jgi:phosphate:Na+ symporter